MKQLSRRRPKGDDIELDLGRYELRRNGRRIKLEKKPMELLIFLVRRRQQLVSREEIQAKLWHTDLFIDTEWNINNIVGKIRRALGDNSAKPRFLETVVGKGYRFVGPIRIVSPLYGSSDLSESADGKTPCQNHAHTLKRTFPLLGGLPIQFLGHRISQRIDPTRVEEAAMSSPNRLSIGAEFPHAVAFLAKLLWFAHHVDL